MSQATARRVPPKIRETASERRQRRLRPDSPGWRQTLYDIIFEAHTPSGRAFDIALLVAILASVVVVSLETIPAETAKPAGETTGEDGLVRTPLAAFSYRAEWVLTILFTIEYVARLACVKRPVRYALSFWGLVDLISTLPMYLTLLISPVSGSFMVLRSVRLLRVFRVLKLWRMMSEADRLSYAVWRSREKVVVFLAVVLVSVTISATLMYYIETVWAEEPSASEFTSIPQAMYWAIVTMTTVGYGDVVPHTTAGKIVSAALILLGYSLIIVPTSFVSAELTSEAFLAKQTELHPCPSCGLPEHRRDALYCHQCGASLDA